jgi:hypothetical protein
MSPLASTSTGDGNYQGPSAVWSATSAGGLFTSAGSDAHLGTDHTAFFGGPWDGQELVSLKPPVRVVTVDDGAYRLDRYTASARPGDPPEPSPTHGANERDVLRASVHLPRL